MANFEEYIKIVEYFLIIVKHLIFLNKYSNVLSHAFHWKEESSEKYELTSYIIKRINFFSEIGNIPFSFLYIDIIDKY